MVSAFFRRLAMLVSYGVFSFINKVMARLVASKLLGLGQEPASWIPYSNGSKRVLGISVLKLYAHRWNCHAVIASTQVVRVQSEISVNLTAARAAAEAWTVVIYRNDGHHQTVATLGVSTATDADGWVRVPVEAGGRYSAALRYYHCREGAEYPEVRCDGELLAKRSPVGNEVQAHQRMLEGISQRTSIYNRFHQYHLLWALANHHRYPVLVLGKRMIPIGNPETLFFFGLVPKGAQVRIRLQPEQMKTNFVFVTLFNNRSEPVQWLELEKAEDASPPALQEGFFLMRIHPKDGTPDPSLEGAFVVVSHEGKDVPGIEYRPVVPTTRPIALPSMPRSAT
jgi:hypothetical protein